MNMPAAEIQQQIDLLDIIYINLDNACSRRQKFAKTSAKRWRATPREEVPPFIDKKMSSMYNFGRDSHLARCGCFISHTKLLEDIVKNKRDNVLILEDDAIKVNSLPTDYPKDGITYIGGFIYNRRMMDETPPEVNSKAGINLCPPEYRILGCLAYIIPSWQLAYKILNKIYSQYRFKAIDIMLGNIGIKQYYYYPGCYREEGATSQISDKNKKNKIMTEDYKFISIKKYNAKEEV